ncbi:MAG: hypothetical protein ACJAZ9_000737 [Neolewinella sp.]
MRGYLKLAAVHDVDLSAVLKLPPEQLRQILCPDKVRPAQDRKAVFDAKVDDWVKELSGVGVTKFLLYEEYKQAYPDDYSSSQFHVHLAREIGRLAKGFDQQDEQTDPFTPPEHDNIRGPAAYT